jgi:16S rRNA (guanine527-N7)-methyltransferase
VDPERVAVQIEQWLGIWEKWNNKISLTAERDALTVVQQHFFGSLLYRQGLGKAQNLLDIGSGAGFPGIPLKLIEPDLAVTLVESQRKRAGFLQEIVRALNLEGVQIINDRVEQLGREHHRKYEAIVFRYVDKVETCLTLAEPFLKFAGRVVIIKEPEYQLPTKGKSLPLNCKAEIPVQTWSGAASKLMVFGGCFT